MMQFSELVTRLTRLFNSKKGSTCFINGSPGSGKSYLLDKLSRDLPTEMPQLQVLGPFQVAGVDSIGALVLQDLFEYGFLDEPADRDVGLDLNNTWHWLRDRLVIGSRQSFVILIDLEAVDPADYDTWRSLFSSARYLEHLWENGPTRILVLIASFWDHAGLERYYQSTNLSFPYTVSHNYLVWDGISADEMASLVQSRFPEENSPIPYGRLIHEITGGHPGGAIDLLGALPADGLSVSDIFSATHGAARTGSAGKELIEAWTKFPGGYLDIFRDLISMRQLSVQSIAPQLENLRAAGVIQLKPFLNHHYAVPRSWYVELLIRYHSEELGLGGEKLDLIDIGELVPRVSVLNLEAYQVINEIENLARNFVAVRLCMQRENNLPILQNRFTKFDKVKKMKRDAHENASEWRDRAKDKGLPVHLNPLIVYLSTQDLAGMIRELATKDRVESWMNIADALLEISYIRDGVMHNQIVDDCTLIQLYDLRAEIYEALSQSVHEG
jgi:hypothetical protein